MVLLVVKVGGTDGVAVFSSGWRVTSFAIIPVMGIAAALTSIAAAAYGAKAYGKLNRSLEVGIKMALFIEMSFSVFVFVFARQLTVLFTWAEGSAHLTEDLTLFFRVTSLMHFSAAFGMLSSAVFQAIGRGFNSLVVTLLRTILLSTGFSYILGVTLDLGLPGIWFGITFGNLAGAAVGYGWLIAHLRGLRKNGDLSHAPAA
jgi:Na+-driven multidrug efflux pump